MENINQIHAKDMPISWKAIMSVGGMKADQLS